MTIELSERGVAIVLLDVEGTTTPLSFVTDVLFPYARLHLRAFVRSHASDPAVRQAIEALHGEHEREAPYSGAPTRRDGDDSAIAYAEWLMERDSKSPGLKALQGLIWKVGFDAGDLRGEVFDDVPAALRSWRGAGVRTAIYSSGSVLAQKLLFATTPHGDLTRDIDAHFDTAVGAKRDPASYRRISEALVRSPGSMLFVSDISSELEAARSAGCQVALIVRPGNAPQPVPEAVPVIRTFAELITYAVPRRPQNPKTPEPRRR